MSGTSWRAVSAPTQKSNGDLARASGLTASPGRVGADGSQARVITGSPGPSRRASIGLIGSSASTPDDAAFTMGAAVGSGIIVDIHARMKRWEAITTTHWFAGQGDHVFTADLSWAASIHPNGNMRLALSVDGVNFFGNEAAGRVPFQPGQEGWVRMSYGNVFGSGIQTYAWSTDGITWTQIGGNINLGGYVQPRDSAQPITVPGVFGDSAEEMVVFEMRVSINGVLVTNPRFDTIGIRAPSFVDDQRRTWTITEPGLIGVA